MPLSSNPLIRKLLHFTPLSKLDQNALDALGGCDESIAGGVDIAVEGAASRSAFLIKAGMAIRYRDLRDGGRQIISFLLPGDLCDWWSLALAAMDHSIGTITQVRIAPISRHSLMQICSDHPQIATAFRRSSLQEEAILREHIVSLGRRNARSRVAHLLCELLWRNAAVGLSEGQNFLLPLTQVELGDALGLTSVSVNRILKDFRCNGLITIQHRIIKILDIGTLQDIASFNDVYLQQVGTPEELEPSVDQLPCLVRATASVDQHDEQPDE
jgi:CRP-like cAMP-binding protein